MLAEPVLKYVLPFHHSSKEKLVASSGPSRESPLALLAREAEADGVEAGVGRKAVADGDSQVRGIDVDGSAADAPEGARSLDGAAVSGRLGIRALVFVLHPLGDVPLHVAQALRGVARGFGAHGKSAPVAVGV